MGAWLYSLESWGHNWVDSHFLSKGIGLGKMVSPTSTFINEGGHCPNYYLLGQHGAEGTKMVRRLFGVLQTVLKQKDFSKCPEPNLNKNKDLETGRFGGQRC